MDEARKKGICAEGYSQMRADDMDSLIDYYVENPDWCMERNFPDYRTLKAEFSDCEDKGVFVGRRFHGELLNDLQAYIFHKCSGTIKVGLNSDKSLIPMLYLANNCKLRIVGVGVFRSRNKKDRIRVPVYVFGDNALSAKDNNYVQYAIFREEVKLQ